MFVWYTQVTHIPLGLSCHYQEGTFDQQECDLENTQWRWQLSFKESFIWSWPIEAFKVTFCFLRALLTLIRASISLSYGGVIAGSALRIETDGPSWNNKTVFQPIKNIIGPILGEGTLKSTSNSRVFLPGKGNTFFLSMIRSMIVVVQNIAMNWCLLRINLLCSYTFLVRLHINWEIEYISFRDM